MLVRKRTLLAFCAAALVAVIGVTAALAGSGGRATPVTEKPKSAKATFASSEGVVESSTPTSDAASYWTEERMRSAGPLEKTVPGGSTTVAPSPQAPKSASPASTAKAPTVTESPAAKKASTKSQTNTTRSQAANDGGTVSADSTDDAAAYWTPERMDDAAAVMPGVEGGDSSQGSAGPGPVPGTP